MKELPIDKGLLIYDINWSTDTAGPSPNNNQRVELFLLGCERAMQGNECKGCFNTKLWNNNIAKFSRDPVEVADEIAALTDNRYITISGGEPLDQIEHLIPLCKRLKEHGFHIMMYTWRDVFLVIGEINYINGCLENYDTYKDIDHLEARELFKHLDIVVDGEFIQEECLYDKDLGDGLLSSIGSGNQRIWDIKARNENYLGNRLRLKMRDLAGLYIKPDTNDLVYITKK